MVRSAPRAEDCGVDRSIVAMGWTPDDSAMVLGGNEKGRRIESGGADAARWVGVKSLFFEDPELEVVGPRLGSAHRRDNPGWRREGWSEPIRFLDLKLEAKQKKIDALFLASELERSRKSAEWAGWVMRCVRSVESAAYYPDRSQAKQTANVAGEGASGAGRRRFERSALDGIRRRRTCARVPAHPTLPSPGSSQQESAF